MWEVFYTILIKSEGGKKYCVYDVNNNMLAKIGGSTTNGHIKFTNNTMLNVHLHMSIKGFYYTVTSHKQKEKSKEKRSFLQVLADAVEVDNGKDTDWRINADLMGGVHKFLYDDEVVGETKLSLSLVSNAQYYIFVQNADNIENIILLILAIRVIDEYRSEQASEISERDNRRERRQDKKENQREKRTENKKEKVKKEKNKWFENDFYYHDDYDDDDND